MLLLTLLACTSPSTDTNGGDTDPTGDTDTGPDVRFDRNTWPDSVGGVRPAKVVAPLDGWDGESLLPVVVMLHGYSASSTLQDYYFGLSDRAESMGFVLVMPDGLENPDGYQYWNATDYCCDFEPSGVDDVGYLLDLLDDVEAAFPVDPDRIGFVGHSNGGFMSYRMACEAPERISAIASLAGATFLDEADCVGDAPVHVLQAHGTADTTIYYEGRASQYPSAEETVQRWATKAGCTGDLAAAGSAIDYDSAVVGAETQPLAYDGGCEKDVQLWRMDASGHIPYVNDAWVDAFVGFVLDHPR